MLSNPKVTYSLSDIFINPNERYIRFKVEQGGSHYQIINIYSPNHERVCFIKQIAEWLGGSKENAEAVIGGDHNCVLNNHLDRFNCRDSTDIGQINFTTWSNLVIFKMCDTEEIQLYENIHGSLGEKSRIDYWLISTSLDSQIDETVYDNSAPFSDQKGVLIKFRTAEVKHGMGLWKLNASVIKTALFQEAFKHMWKEWKNKQQEFGDIRIWWDLGRKRTNDVAIWCADQLANERKFERTALENRVKSNTSSKGVLDLMKLTNVNKNSRISIFNRQKEQRWGQGSVGGKKGKTQERISITWRGEMQKISYGTAS